jgi:hypothetical protein
MIFDMLIMRLAFIARFKESDILNLIHNDQCEQN